MEISTIMMTMARAVVKNDMHEYLMDSDDSNDVNVSPLFIRLHFSLFCLDCNQVIWNLDRPIFLQDFDFFYNVNYYPDKGYNKRFDVINIINDLK